MLWQVRHTRIFPNHNKRFLNLEIISRIVVLDITVVNDVILVGVYFSPAYSWMLYLTKPAYYS
jgi:hypothetical protein